MITLIAAMDKNNLIGRDDTIPWHIPADFQHFKATTLGHPIVMGRKTYESLPRRPLPGRRNIVVSRGDGISGVEVYDDLNVAIEAASTDGEVFVIGGQSIYEQTILFADKLLITHINGEYEGNAWFPVIDPTIWNKSRILSQTVDFNIAEYERLV